MNTRYPKIRKRFENGSIAIREALSICFYTRHTHQEVAPLVLESLERYFRETGPALGLYADSEGYWHKLDDKGWPKARDELLSSYILDLTDVSPEEDRYGFSYRGRSGKPYWPDEVTSMCFWLPTEYLEEHGPARFRRLAVELANSLPFCSGSAGLAFRFGDLVGVLQIVRELALRYPGIDFFHLDHASNDLNDRIWGPSWLTFLGQPALGELGGVARLRPHLRSPGTTVEALDGDRAIITLGSWPEAGDAQQGGVQLPAYRELAKVLEPCLYREQREDARGLFRTVEERRRWERRFLD